MGLANKAQLLGLAGKRRFTEAHLPIADMDVRIQSLTERELSHYQTAVLTGQSGKQSLNRARLLDATRRLIGMCVVDADNKRMFEDADLDAIAGWDAKDTQALYEACTSHCGISRDDVEDLVKNSERIPAAD